MSGSWISLHLFALHSFGDFTRGHLNGYLALSIKLRPAGAPALSQQLRPGTPHNFLVGNSGLVGGGEECSANGPEAGELVIENPGLGGCTRS